jgi:hypothetical protein
MGLPKGFSAAKTRAKQYVLVQEFINLREECPTIWCSDKDPKTSQKFLHLCG